MDLCEYQEGTKTTAIYSNKIIYPALGIVGECGEVADKVKKMLRDDGGEMTPERKAAMAKELGDCCWYLASICSDTNLDLKMIHKMRGSALVQRIRKMVFPRLVLFMNKQANTLARLLERLYYDYNCSLGVHIPTRSFCIHISEIITCIEEIGIRCDFSLESICQMNIEKLLDRKSRGTLSGDGDNR